MSADPSAPRVLFVDHSAVLGGAELSLLDLAASAGDASSVVLFEPGPFAELLKAREVRVQVLGGTAALGAVKKSGGLGSPGALVAVMRTAWALSRIATRYSVVYANTPKSFVIGALAAFIARRPVIWHLRDILGREHFTSAGIRLLISVANARAATVVANSAATAEAFVAAGGRRSLVRVVHNGIDAAPFEAVTRHDAVAMRESLGIPADAFVVGSFSRLHPWKGHRVLFDALDTLPNVHALIVGGALFSGEMEYEAELRARAESGSLAGRVHVLGVRDDVPALMAACDAVVHTSTSPEPFGRVLVEALLARRPVIATDGGGVREVVQDGVTALVVPPGSPERLARAIASLRDDPDLAKALALAGAADVRHRFTREAMVSGAFAVIRDVVRSGK